MVKKVAHIEVDGTSAEVNGRKTIVHPMGSVLVLIQPDRIVWTKVSRVPEVEALWVPVESVEPHVAGIKHPIGRNQSLSGPRVSPSSLSHSDFDGDRSKIPDSGKGKEVVDDPMSPGVSAERGAWHGDLIDTGERNTNIY